LAKYITVIEGIVDEIKSYKNNMYAFFMNIRHIVTNILIENQIL